MSKLTLRLAKLQDAPALLSIYSHYVDNTSISFEFSSPKPDEFAERIQTVQKNYPYLVCESQRKPVAFAYCAKHMQRAAYQWNAEMSVYVDRNYTRCGIGQAFFFALIELSRMQNLHNLYGLVTVPNRGSERLHELFGFTRIGTYHKTGFKFGEWHDVAIFEKRLASADAAPEPLLTFSGLPAKQVQDILDKSSKYLKLATS